MCKFCNSLFCKYKINNVADLEKLYHENLIDNINDIIKEDNDEILLKK